LKVYRGSSRTVFCLGGLAIKVVQLSRLWKIFKNLLWMLIKGKSLQRREENSHETVCILCGLVANLTEYFTYVYTEAPFLAPVYFTLGIFSVQKYVEGDKPKNSELRQRFGRLTEKARFHMDQVTLHSWQPSSFRVTEKGLVMIDYGDSLISGFSTLSTFLHRWGSELEIVLSNDTFNT